MARNVTVLQVFLASPSDLQPERDIVEETIIELNRLWGKGLGVSLELWRWETNSRPAFGEDAQAIINSQVGEEYDIFVGLLWGRFGTATPRAASGTQEEFERAVSRRKQSGNLPEIMLYFKDAPLAPSKIDSNQLKLVQEFKKFAASNGVLYSEFSDGAGFQSSFRAHLSSLVQAQVQQLRAPADSPSQALVAIEEDEPGFLDFIERYESRMHDFNSVVEGISAATVRIGDQLTSHTKAIADAGESMRQTSFARKIVRASAEDLVIYADYLRRNIPEVRKAREGAFDSLASALVFYEDFQGKEVDNLVPLRGSLNLLLNSIDSALAGIDGFQASVSRMPRLTSEINRARREVVSQLAIFRDETFAVISTVKNILGTLDRLMAGPEK